MANPHKGEYGFKVEDKEYVLRFTTDTICDLETELGLPMIEIEQQSIGGKLRMELVRTLFLAGLTDRQPDLALDARRALFKELLPVDAVKHVATAWRAAFGVKDEEDAAGGQNPPQPAQTEASGTGPVSTKTGAE
jgi:hypothetical protein